MIRCIKGWMGGRGWMFCGTLAALAIFAATAPASLRAEGDLPGEAGEVRGEEGDSQTKLFRSMLEHYAKCDSASRDRSAARMANAVRSDEPEVVAAAVRLIMKLEGEAARSGQRRLLHAAADWKARIARFLQPQKSLVLLQSESPAGPAIATSSNRDPRIPDMLSTRGKGG